MSTEPRGAAVEGTRGLRRALGPRPTFRRLLAPFGHIVVLSAFAVAQPLFNLFSQNAAFFAARSSPPRDIVVLALALVLLPPAVLLLFEGLAALVGERVWWLVHLFFVGGLAAIVVLEVEKRAAESAVASLIVVAAIAGVLAAAAYARLASVRTFLTVLLPAPLVFAALFLFQSPVSRLVLVDEHVTLAVPVDAQTPVVMLMFDELSTVSLLDGEGQLDAGRFPNFAALGRTATFYRNATTVHAYTDHAVPAILTGRIPGQDDLPIYADHPQNIFTLLGNGYRMRANESVTRLCPAELCHPTDVEPVGERLSTLASDSAIIYLHALLPDKLARRLPPVDRTWRNFQGMNVDAGSGRAAVFSPCAPVCFFVKSMSAGEPGTFHYLHVQMPHIPWRFLPSGKHYIGDTRVIPGLTGEDWEDDRSLTDAAYERYLLQLGYADRALGIVLARLRAQGLYDRALVIVMADHGLSFEPGKKRREASESTLHDIAFMPLIVKLPKQRRGRVDDGFARTIDVVPTIADALGIRIPWEVDGRSLLDGGAAPAGTVALRTRSGKLFEAPLSKLVSERAATLRRWTSMYGDGSWDGLYRAGPHGDLVGLSLASLDPGTAAGTSVDLDGRALLDAYDPRSPSSPAYLTGRIEGGRAGNDLAIAVNGRVAATTQTYEADGEIRFAVFLPEPSLEAGSNEIEVLLVSAAGRPAFVPPAAAVFTLDGNTIRRADGTELGIDPDAVRGVVEVTSRTERLRFSGWAVSRERERPVDSIAIFVDGDLVYLTRGESFRTVEAEQHEGIDNAAFRFTLPAGPFPPAGSAHEVRIFAVSEDTAAELEYAPGYVWKH